MTAVTITDVLQARRLLAGHLPPTPLWSYPTLDRGSAAKVLLKHETNQPTGAFKVRGGLNLLASLTPQQRRQGVLGYSTGNHAQSLAYAAREFGAPCVIVMPADPNPVKARAVRALGAELVEHGPALEEAAARAVQLAAERGMLLVSAGDEPRLIAGVGTAYLEIFEQAPQVDTVVVPIGSGTGAAAACLVAAAVAPGCQVIGVQSSASPAAHDSWRAGELLARPNRTRVEGVATGTAFALPQQVLREHLTDFVLVDDDAIEAAQRRLLLDAHTLTESAGAAAYAALLARPDLFADRTVALVCTGANAPEAALARLLQGESAGLGQ